METHVTECIPLLCSSFLLLQWKYTEHEPHIMEMISICARSKYLCVCIAMFVAHEQEEGSDRGYTTSIPSQYYHLIGLSIN